MGKWFVMAVLIVIITGCGKKEEAPPEPVVDASVIPAELPELEQNKLYLNNPLVSGPQDIAFEPVPNEMQELSEEEQFLLGPPAD
jgi:hypothetical protein